MTIGYYNIRNEGRKYILDALEINKKITTLGIGMMQHNLIGSNLAEIMIVKKTSAKIF